jgi:hypothetical protein
MGTLAGNYYGGIVKDGLVLMLDAAKKDSYDRLGTTWRDISWNGNNGTLINSPVFNGDNGGYINFDGTNEYANLNNNNASVNVPLNHSLCVWCRPKGPGTDSDNAWVIMRGGDTSPFIEWGIAFEANNMRFRILNGASDSSVTYVSQPINSVSYNNWYQVCFSISSTNRVLYINGSQVGNQLGSFSLQSKSYSVRTNIARWGNATFLRQFNGDISLIQLYHKTLSASEILQNYNATKGRYL